MRLRGSRSAQGTRRPVLLLHHITCIYTHMPRHPDPILLTEISTHCACFNLRRAARAITQLYDHTLAPSGLRATQLTLLVGLAKAGPVPFTRLAAALGMDRTTLTRNLAPLERDGLVTQKPGADRRVKLVEITDTGLTTLARAIPLWREAQQRITDGLGAGNWDSLRTQISQITTIAGEP